MTHLRIEQNGITEEVTSSVISKLYEIINSGVDASSNLQGRLHCPISYRAYVNYLTTEYPDLYISVDDYAIPFEDPNMLSYLNSIGVGSNGMITESLAAAATVVANSQNTEVTKFNELRYFTNITQSRNGWTGSASGYTRFAGWTALEEVDISNFTSLGHVGGYGYEDTFGGCTALKTVTASDKLTRIGCRAFYGCTNLEHITGLSGTIQISNLAFSYCSKLPDEDIVNVEFEPAYEGTNLRGGEAFVGTNFTEITLSSNTTKIPSKMFYNCSNLETVNGLGSNITVIVEKAFKGCTALTSVTGLSNLISILNNCFEGCTSLTTIDIDWSNLTSIGASAFKGCKALQISLNCTSLTELGAWSFLNCEKLSLVSSLGSMTYVSESSFEGCKGLTSVNLPSSVTALYDYSFKNCTNLSTINLPSSITTIGKEVFKNSKISNTINLPNLTSLNSSAFSGCGYITSVTNLGSITKIEGDTFYGCTNLTSITIPSTCTSFGTHAFLGCSSLLEINAPNVNLTAVSSSYNSIFSNCTSLQKVILGDCYELGTSWSSHDGGRIHFYNCSSLTTVDVKSLSRVAGNSGYTAFRNCPNMSTFILRSTTIPVNTEDPIMTMSPFGGNNVTLYVPDSALNDYKTAWPDIANKIKGISELPSS